MDTTRNILYRGFLLNDASIQDNIDADTGIGKGIAGCVVQTWDFSDVDIIQFMEKRSLQDGMDAGDPFKGARRLRMSGTLYGKTRAQLFDSYLELRRVLDPVLAQRESPGDHGFLPLYFGVPTNRDGYSTGAIDLRVLAMPRASQVVWQDDQQGGDDGDSLAIPWQATFVMKDPTIMAETPQDYDLSAGGTVSGDFLNRGNYICPLNALIVVGADAGSITLQAGGATLTFTVPASSGNRTIRYNGKEKLLTVEENSVEVLRMDLLGLGAAQVHPLIPDGTSPYVVTFTGVTPQAGSHMWFWETYA